MLGLLVSAIAVAIVSAVVGLFGHRAPGQMSVLWVLTTGAISVAAAAALAIWQTRNDRDAHLPWRRARSRPNG